MKNEKVARSVGKVEQSTRPTIKDLEGLLKIIADYRKLNKDNSVEKYIACLSFALKNLDSLREGEEIVLYKKTETGATFDLGFKSAVTAHTPETLAFLDKFLAWVTVGEFDNTITDKGEKLRQRDTILPNIFLYTRKGLPAGSNNNPLSIALYNSYRS